jgi:hypothetical protein
MCLIIFKFKKNKPSIRNEVVEYYQKGKVMGKFSIETSNGKIHSLIGIQTSGENLESLRFLGRSSILIVPTLGNKGNPYEIEQDIDRPDKFIDNDIRFVNDVYLHQAN